MDFKPSARCLDFEARLKAFMDEHVYPAEPVYERQLREARETGGAGGMSGVGETTGVRGTGAAPGAPGTDGAGETTGGAGAAAHVREMSGVGETTGVRGTGAAPEAPGAGGAGETTGVGKVHATNGKAAIQPPIMEELKSKARQLGLWNMFLPDPEHGAGLSNSDYAPLAEILGRSHIASEACNCSAPDTGNMEVLHLFATEEQRERWLEPLLAGEIRSAFAMTEPDVASSDATNIALRIERDGDHYVLNGRKWWISGVLHPHCRIMIVMGKTRTDGAPPARAGSPYRQQSMVLVPLGTPGVTVVRGLPVFGYHDHEGHAEIVFEDVRVPASNLIAGEGEGFMIAQARLGPGRIHHCMRSLGAAERALQAMCRRAVSRVTFGEPLASRANIQDWIAEARIEIEMARLLTLKAAWLMDTVGNRHARVEIAAIKVAAPNVALKVIDRAIQVHGGGGVSDDFPLAWMYAHLRTLRLADGPDEVHKRSIARRELAPYLPRE